MDLSQLSPDIQLGPDVRVEAEEVQVGRGVELGPGVRICARRLILGAGVRLEADVSLEAEQLELRPGATFGPRCRVGGMGGPCRYFRLGEHTRVGEDCKLLAPAVAVGDYATIHNHTLLNGRRSAVLGHNVWIGQNTNLNCEDDLVIGNHVGIGAYSSIYTHGYFGDLLEGCRVFKRGPVTIEDDVWLLGSYSTIAPGVTIGAKALVLNSSVVSSDVAANSTVGGSPASSLGPNIKPYADVSPGWKLKRVGEFVREFVDECFPDAHRSLSDGYLIEAASGSFRVVCVAELTDDTELPAERPLLVFAAMSSLGKPPVDVTVFDLSRRQYWRTRSSAEIRLLSFLKSYRARFVPADEPRVELPPEFGPTRSASDSEA